MGRVRGAVISDMKYIDSCTIEESLMSLNGHLLNFHFIDYLLLFIYWRTTAQSTLGRGAILRAKTEILKYQPGRVGHVGCRSR